mmetsp:Transcript_14633/g.31737  ORF Transcript_14633/g.31737 Transcript_14633/m.31737 type:complete len:260 (-) Transcript_14633:196-975(-)
MQSDKQDKKKRDKKRKRKSEKKQKRKRDEDDDMLAAAAAWAEGGGGGAGGGGDIPDGDSSDDNHDDGPAPSPAAAEPKHIKRPKHQHNQNASVDSTSHANDQWLTPESITYSVHLTQLPYEAKVREVRSVFEKQNCVITSLRFCYGQRDGRNGGERPFKGVAFCDFADKASLDRALELDKTIFPGYSRRMNVRPTKTKEELADIVEKRDKMLEGKRYQAGRSEKWKSGEKKKRRHIEARRKQNLDGKKKKQRRGKKKSK